jgi:hypothetical protein
MQEVWNETTAKTDWAWFVSNPTQTRRRRSVTIDEQMVLGNEKITEVLIERTGPRTFIRTYVAHAIDPEHETKK